MLELRSCSVGRIYRSGGGTIFKPHRHIIVECDWIRAARRQARRPDLFLYKHAKTGKYMLSYWILRPGGGRGPGYFLELEDMNSHPDHYSKKEQGERLSLSFVRARLRPVDEMEKDRERELVHQKWLEMQMEEDTEREKKDVISYVERKKPWLHKTLWGLKHGELGFVGEREGGEELQAITALLQGRA